jgi:tRNA threonylcarbamoyladenosine biosynthesis protein TsaB
MTNLPVGASLLAFDTSTESMSLALSLPEGTTTLDAAGGAQASARLIPELLALLSKAGRTLAELDAIAFGRGPGAFTGLRTACSVAQGLAYGANKPVVPIDSLLLVAEDARAQLGADVLDVWVAMDARMDEVYAAAYCWQGERWQVVRAPALSAIDALNALWQADPPTVVAGSALGAFGDRLAVGGATVLPEPRSRAEALARLARQLWADGVSVDAAHALPVYLRDKVAQTTAEREMARAIKEGSL